MAKIPHRTRSQYFLLRLSEKERALLERAAQAARAASPSAWIRGIALREAEAERQRETQTAELERLRSLRVGTGRVAVQAD